MFKSTFTLNMGLSLTLLLLTSSYILSAPKLSEEAAKKESGAFLQQLQAMQVSSAAAPFAASDQLSSHGVVTALKTEMVAPDSQHRNLRWKVYNSDQSEVSIDDETGSVVEYSNEGFYHRHDKSPAGPAMPKEEAIRRATAFLQVAGAPVAELRFDDGYERQDGTRTPGQGRASGHFWTLYFRRSYNGIPYRNQYAYVLLQAENGEVISVAVGGDLLPPPSIEENVSRDQAISVGKAQLAASGITNLPVVWVSKMIIQPDTFWQNGNTHPLSDATRVAWLCGFGSLEGTCGVWVDTQTGDVIGGTEAGSLGGSVKLLKPKFGHQLKHSEVKAETSSLRP